MAVLALLGLEHSDGYMTKLLHAVLLLWSAQAVAGPPHLYSASAYQGPVRGEADDLLLLPGYGLGAGDSVVYRALDGAVNRLAVPFAIPPRSTATLGTADLVSLADAPYSLTIRLPNTIDSGHEYALWVVNAAGEWSNPVRINDARPLWITPDEIRLDASAARSGPRLKLVGRNLQRLTSGPAMVRLIGAGRRYTLTTLAQQSGALGRYVADVRLPVGIAPGSYHVQFSRDGRAWVPLPGAARSDDQTLQVLGSQPPQQAFAVGDYTFGDCNPASGRCRAVKASCRPPAGGDLDQTACVTAAIAAARAAGGGTVAFRAGNWILTDPGTWPAGSLWSTKGVSADGILLPVGVDLQGAGRAATVILRAAEWPLAIPTFTLQGRNTVRGLRFRDARVYTRGDSGAAALELGTRWDRGRAYYAGDPFAVSHVTIADNTFEFPFYAIANSGLAIDHLTITGNEFGAFNTAIMLEADTWNAAYRYELRDAAITHNRFYPGSYLDAAIGQGTIATQLGGGTRVDFSDNDADGSSTRYLQHPAIDARGWRAAYFWSLSDNIEMLLAAHNSASCTGDKDGDGEFIAYDNNHNRPGFLELAAPVLAAATDLTAGTSTVTVRGSLLEQQRSYGRSVDVRPTASYYRGDWLQVVQGTGVGQARKITAIRAASTAAGAAEEPKVAFTVTPAFDVLPGADSRVTDGRQLWQVYTVANTVDHRTPLCRKSNVTRRAGGLITLSARSSDTSVEGNKLYDSSGIQVVHQFMLTDAIAGVSEPNSMTQFASEIRGNLLDGAYDERDGSPQAESGISVDFAATPHTEPPPTLSHGLSISHNAVLRVGARPGAIAIRPSWYVGPVSPQLPGVRPWKLATAVLIHHNELTAPIPAPGPGPAIGLSAGEASAPIGWRTVLYANRCSTLTEGYARLADFGTQTMRYCPLDGPATRSHGSQSCECEPTVDRADLNHAGSSSDGVDIAVQAEHDSLAVGQDGVARVRLEVINHGTSAAINVTLSAEPSAELDVRAMDAGVAACPFVGRVVLCLLGTIPAGARVPINAEVALTRTAPASLQFTVSRREPDFTVGNDSVRVSVVRIAE
jgi:hypothetical protein